MGIVGSLLFELTYTHIHTHTLQAFLYILFPMSLDLTVKRINLLQTSLLRRREIILKKLKLFNLWRRKYLSGVRQRSDNTCIYFYIMEWNETENSLYDILNQMLCIADRSKL